MQAKLAQQQAYIAQLQQQTTMGMGQMNLGGMQQQQQANNMNPFGMGSMPGAPQY